ncbi:1-aminocyclopropane-1-carboxylate deaminase [Roseivirga sp. 4D4]|uniref:1-aminocyclopropane-1-carboxylate deaminase/D-cysteine desulfhydrase n=1 Tax=Roseivirga sp. 4D4 TaxID=1889784 RepID=UPI0008529055|nr:pyridoxal-phosphate dependent enzyme [Roseivirga sp. 4D4]OEK02756.1 1-aminocyclopropane-1-carboxylate deaminase [Roseivirga sp. 4D4]
MPSPVQEIKEELFKEKGVQVFIKREDLNHPTAPGNKWRKLKYNLEEAKRQGHDTLLTFGGAYSNHIYAVAGVGKAHGFKTIGVIRGEETLPLNDTLSYAASCGMRIHYLNRTQYRDKDSANVKQTLQYEFGDFYTIPEGGTNNLAIKGCTEIISELEEDYSHYCLSVGTGGTICGIIQGLGGSGSILGFSSLKGSFLTAEVEKLNSEYVDTVFANWQINNDFHFGGYAKVKPELLKFTSDFESRHQILLDPVYTGKAMYGLYQLIHNGHFKSGDQILFIHTGGLQGRKGFGL